MKTCRRCGAEKHIDEFNRSLKNTDGRHSYCRSCQHDHYVDNSARHRSNARRTSAARRAQARGIVVAAMHRGCVDCGVSDIRVLDFDHVRGPKIDSVSNMVRRGRATTVILNEISKCEVRCRNCHAIATVSRLERTWHDAFLNESPRRESNPRQNG